MTPTTWNARALTCADARLARVEERRLIPLKADVTMGQETHGICLTSP